MRVSIQVTIIFIALAVVLLSVLPANAQPTSGLLAYYPFTGNANDASGNGVNLTAQSGATLTSDRFAVGNRCYVLSGTNSGLSANIGSAFSVSNVTLCAWIQINGRGDNSPRLIAVGPTFGASHPYEFGLNGIGNPRTLFFNGISSTQSLSTGGAWTHVAVTYNGSQVKFYINGELSSTAAYSATLGSFSSAKLQIGYNDNGFDRFDGWMDEIRIYNRALSASEIYQCYSPTNGLMAFYRMNDTFDSTGQTVRLTASNVAASADRYGTANQCYTFNGNTSQMYNTVGSGFSTTKVSLCAWISVTGAGDHNPRIMSVGPTGSSYQYYRLNLVGTGSTRYISFGVSQNGTSTAFQHNSTGTIPTNGSWHFVVATYDGAQVKLYIDGALSGTHSQTAALGSFSNTARLQIGYSDNGYDRFAGKIDDVRLYNRALTESEVSSLYTPPSLRVTYNGNTITPPLNFGVYPIGETSQRVIRLQNNGGNTLTISNPSITGDFSMTVLPSSLAPNEMRDITITFQPSAPGTRNGTLSFTHNADGSPYSLSLTGTGGVLTLTSHNGGVSVAAGSTSNITWTSQGLSGYVMIYLNTNYPNGSWTSLARGNLNGQYAWIPSSGQITTNARIRVAKGGDETTFNDVSDVNFSIVESGGPQLSVTSNGYSITPPIDFGLVSLSQTYQQVVRLSNTGTSALTITNPSITGDYAMSSVPSSIAAGAYSNVTLTFAPTAAGTRTGTFSFSHNAPNSPYSVSLTGNAGVITLSSPNGGETAPVGVATNVNWTCDGLTGSAVISINTYYPSGDWVNLNSQPIPITNGTWSWTPTSDQISSSVRIRVSRMDDGSRFSDVSNANFSVVASAPVDITNNGNSVNDSLDFGEVPVDPGSAIDEPASSELVVRITNILPFPIPLTNPVISGDFSMSTLPAWLAPGAHCDVTLTFIPTDVGTRSGGFAFNYFTGYTPCSIILTGLGVTYTSGGIPVVGTGGAMLPWTPSLPSDPGTANLPPLSIVFPGASGVTPSSINVLYCATPPIPENPPFLPESSIERFWTIDQTGGSEFGADLTFRFTAAEDVNNLRSGLLAVARSTDEGATWMEYASGLSVTPIGGAFEVLVPNVNEFSSWALGSVTILPVELASFNAVTGDGRIILNWRTESERNNAHFNIYRSTFANERGELITRVFGHGNSSTRIDYTYTDERVINGTTYFYRIADVSLDGIEHMNHFVVSETPAMQAFGEIPIMYTLDQNYPNPFNPKTCISYGIQKEGHVRLFVYNLMGQEVARLVDEYQTPNMYQVEFTAAHLPTGTYYYSLTTDGFSSVKKMVLMK
ncbi:MAG: choice-of-anchor D domain-containing protein [bacterium]|nr:choice-of-anchor D domain-containing protein [bacterium]